MEKVKGSDRVTFSLCETITPGDENHLLPAQLTGRDIWHLLAPFRRYICAYATTRDVPPQLAAVLGQELND